MKHLLRKNLIRLILLALVFSTVTFTFPKKAEAQWATFDASNFFQNTLTAINTSATSFSTYSSEFKEYVLDPIATGMAKAVIRQITTSIVNWINSGFEGSPSFVQNPGGFLLDVADQVSGDFLAKYGGPLTDLCTPFSIDIRLALAFKFRPNLRERYSCTLGTIIKNSKNAIEGASINGFTAGDFRQGGWPAFVSLTTEPQNNVIGAYLELDSELSAQVASAQISQKEEISNGRGFLSWRDPSCKKDIARANAAVEQEHKDRIARYDSGAGYNANESLSAPSARGGTGSYEETVKTYNSGGDVSALTLQSDRNCPINTPGSLIVSNLEANVNGPLHELQLADELNEIVNALFSQLATQILTKGLSAVSGNNPSDNGSYVNKILDEEKNGNPQMEQIRKNLVKNVDKYIADTTKYKEYKDEALQVMIEARTAYESAKACYVNKSPTVYQVQIQEIDGIINQEISPIATRLLSEAKGADERLQKLNDINEQADRGTTVNDLRDPSATFSQLIQDRTLTDPRALQEAKEELKDVKKEAARLKQGAKRKLEECQVTTTP